MILGCGESSLRMEISLRVVEGGPYYFYSILMFLTAMISEVLVFMAL